MKYILLISWITYFSVLHAQKIGLVLSGGGALGYAHVGVLKALEENKIPIDYVTGTSMGALVGAFYAAGYSAWEMEQLSLSYNDIWLAPGLSVNEQFFFKKDRVDGSFIQFPISFKNSSKLPANLISDFEINFGLLKYLAGASGKAKDNFDSLFVPFRCMAADIFEKKSYSLKSGSLPFAVRASIAVPLFFYPVSNNEYKTLYDGGIYDNFPVAAMQKEFKPDFIIGVHVGGAPPKREEIEEKGTLVEHLLFQNMDQETWQKMPPNSHLIMPYLDDKSATDFSNISENIRRGYEATIACIEDIKREVGRLEDSVQLAARRKAFRENWPPLRIDDVQIHGVSPGEEAYIRRTLKIHEGTITIEDLRKAYFKLKADGVFNGVFPELRFNSETGGFTLSFHVRPSKRLLVKFGGCFYTPIDHQLSFGAQYSDFNYIGYSGAVDLTRGSFANYASIRGRLDFPTKVPMFAELENSVMSWNLLKITDGIFSTKNQADISITSFDLSPRIGIPIRATGRLVGGFSFNRLNFSYYSKDVVLNTDTLDNTSLNSEQFFITVERNSLNKKMYADKGSYVFLSLRASQGQENFTPGSSGENESSQFHRWIMAKFKYINYIQFSSNVKAALCLETGYSSLPIFSNLRSTQLSSF
ncbi:MAG: patatin-like phospholipase family protein, partial [Bacteroidia bacterium]|nr:patatin-like phospholipase family protein [Bacteroidia bacterium]